MKKLFVSVLAIAAAVACNNAEVLDVPTGAPIQFDNAFVQNASRADVVSTTKETLDAFDVWAYIENKTGIVLTDEDVKKGNGQWGYANLQYWAPGHAYYFKALAPMNSTNWEYIKTDAVETDEVSFTNVDGSEDLLYAYAEASTVGKNPGDSMEAVKLTFNHLLAKVDFQFTNGFATENVKVNVKNVKMTAVKSAKVALNGQDATWSNHDGEFTLEFGKVLNVLESGKSAVVTTDRLVIPTDAAYEYTISFDVDVYYGEVLTIEDRHFETKLKGVALELGNAYNLSATINQENLDMAPIVFEVENVNGWVEKELDGAIIVENGKAVAQSADDLATIADAIANETLPSNTNIVLKGDIDLADLGSRSIVSNWNPIGTSENPFTGIFDGKGYTIKNLALVEEVAKEGKAYIGFFGYAKDATIKNVTFENVYINIPCLDIDHSQGHIGAVAGSLEGTSTIENVTVKGDITVYATQTANGASRVAVIAGGNSYGNVTMKNVHVIANEGSSLIANNNTGALAGQLQGKMVFENCSSNIDVTANKFFAGGLVGIAAGDSYIKNCHTSGDIAVVAGREGRHNDEYRVGGIAGGWADGKTKVCTLEGCSYTGKVSGKNADGSVAEPLDYMGYVGRGYTLANCEGSKVVIDGTEFVQKYDNVYGVYTINGLTPVATADELIAALEANEGVIFMNDIKIEPASMSNAYGATGINVKNGQTIDGNGHTLNIKGAGGTWDSGINTTGGLIKNLTVTGSFRGIFINHTSSHSEKVVLENVTIGGNGTVYTISCDQGLYQGIEATNCTFNGWTSFAKTAGEAKFVNCYFGAGSGYKYCRPYSNTEFVGCTFCPGYAVDTTRATVTFTECTWEE